MAKYTITHRCGHDETHQIGGKGADRDNKAKWLETTDCGACFRVAKQAERDAANAAAANTNAEAGLATLTGSDKQIAWAEAIRATAQDLLTELIERSRDTAMHDVVKSISGEIMTQSSARWWIDNRDNFSGGVAVLVNYLNRHYHDRLTRVKRRASSEKSIE